HQQHRKLHLPRPGRRSRHQFHQHRPGHRLNLVLSRPRRQQRRQFRLDQHRQRHSFGPTHGRRVVLHRANQQRGGSAFGYTHISPRSASIFISSQSRPSGVFSFGVSKILGIDEKNESRTNGLNPSSPINPFPM